MIQNLTPYDILATGTVVRWHTLRTARQQTLADHKARVALLAVWLGHRLPVGRFGHHDELAVLRLALLHDMPETQYGDVPNPSKRALNELQAGPDATGSRDYDSVVDGLFWEARGAENPMVVASDLALRLLRVADVVEAACFYWQEGLTKTRPSCPNLHATILAEALGTVSRELPDLLRATAEVLVGAEVPEDLVDRIVEGLAA
jgi:5'-deoxynucleotidase